MIVFLVLANIDLTAPLDGVIIIYPHIFAGVAPENQNRDLSRDFCFLPREVQTSLGEKLLDSRQNFFLEISFDSPVTIR